MKLLVLTASFIIGLLASNFAKACDNKALTDNPLQPFKVQNYTKSSTGAQTEQNKTTKRRTTLKTPAEG